MFLHLNSVDDDGPKVGDSIEDLSGIRPFSPRKAEGKICARFMDIDRFSYSLFDNGETYCTIREYDLHRSEDAHQALTSSILSPL